MPFAHKSLLELKDMIEKKQASPKEIWEYFHARASKHDTEIGAFLDILENFEEKDNTPLAGLPLGVKDIFCKKNTITTGASKMLKDFNAPYESTLITKLETAGMNTLGKCNMDEFAMGSSGENSAFGNTKNPHDLERIPGGSSSGSAAAVAAGLVPAALGTDTGGSIRQPASMCGIVGFKPSYGRNSRFGVMPMASSLDCPGTFTNTVQDAAFLYELMNGHDPLESSSLPGHDEINPKIWETSDLKGVKVGVPKEYFEEGLDAGVKEQIENTIAIMKDLGAEIQEISLPMTKYAVAAYYIICPAEVSTNLPRLDGIRYGHSSESTHANLDEMYLNNRGEGLGAEPERRSIIGSYVLSAGFYDAYYKKAAQVRTLIIEDFQKAFDQVDIIVGPVAPSTAWKIGDISDDPLKMYLEDAYTIPASLAGLPGLSLPCGFAASSDGENSKLPVGIQMLCPRLGEQRLFEIAQVLESKLNLRESLIPQNYGA